MVKTWCIGITTHTSPHPSTPTPPVGPAGVRCERVASALKGNTDDGCITLGCDVELCTTDHDVERYVHVDIATITWGWEECG